MLGRAAEDCLESILALGCERRSVRVKDLARRLAVSAPTVVSALSALERRGLVEHEHYGGVYLTPRGRSRADEVYRRHRLLRRFLQDVAGVAVATAERDACRLEHALSAESVTALARLVELRGDRRSRRAV
jgi:DtxR family Mn-dependent transcriptional regulator